MLADDEICSSSATNYIMVMQTTRGDVKDRECVLSHHRGGE